MTVEEIRGDYENFPVGLRVLAVDDDPICLKLLETLLRKCQYHVLSANGDPKLVMKGVTHGACDYLVKPVRIEELRNIWQHVIRRKKIDPKNQNNSSDQAKARQESLEGHGSPLTGNTDHNGKFNRKRKDEDDESEDNGNESEDPGTQKKPRVVWSIELHRKFVGAVNQLGIEKAVPKRILDLMNVDGLTRENVASHLQALSSPSLPKYRLYLKRISSVATQQANMAAALGVKDSPFMHMSSLDGLGDFRTLAGPRLGNVALSPFSTNGMLGRLNSSANVNLRNLTPSPLVQPSQAQNLTNSITSLGKMHLVLSPGNQNANLFQGIPSSLELDQLQQNKGTNFNSIDNSRLFTNGQQALSVGGFGNQPTHEMASFNSESFNACVSGSSNLLDPGKCNENWQNTIESSKMHPNPLLSAETFHSLPLNGTRDNNSSNGPYFQNNSIDLSSGMALGSSEQRQNYAQSLNSNFGNGVVSPLGRSLDQNNGILNQKMDMFMNGRFSGSGSTLMQQNENGRSASELRPRSNEDFLLEQPKLQGGFVRQSYDSLDELVNAMIKRV
ncbi:hypothetical protein DH2020_014256 [Rehmannia glutinosa]|uniref:Two-component response regulator n=1 Tax=Rehmannia glutinosa TaxID=99300 RepID=A0ABR0WYF8_REHGL